MHGYFGPWGYYQFKQTYIINTMRTGRARTVEWDMEEVLRQRSRRNWRLFNRQVYTVNPHVILTTNSLLTHSLTYWLTGKNA